MDKFTPDIKQLIFNLMLVSMLHYSAWQGKQWTKELKSKDVSSEDILENIDELIEAFRLEYFDNHYNTFAGFWFPKKFTGVYKHDFKKHFTNEY